MGNRPLPLYTIVALVTLGLLAGIYLGRPAETEAAGFRIIVSPGAKDFPIAIPLPVTPAGDPHGAAERIWEVIRRDLEMTGYFEIKNPDAYIDQSNGVEPGSFRLDDWRVIKAAAVAKSRVQPAGDRLQADIYLYDVGTGEKIVAKRFIGSSQAARHLGHRIADEILRNLTGMPGFFGNRLAAVGTRTGNKEIYVMDIDGEGVLAVTRNGSINLSPAWSPGGDRIAWTSYKRGNPDLYVKDVKRGASRVLSNRQGINTGAAFSPDGTKVALTRSTAGDSDVYVIDATTGAELVRLTRGGGIDVAPDFHPDGERIAFASERSGGSQVYVQGLDGSSAGRVTYEGSFNTDPVFSPDGEKIAFVGRDRNFDVFVVGADGKGMRRITQAQGDNEDPSWSPDGRYLVFSSTRNGRSEVWMSTPDGRHQVPITRSSGGWTQPTWAPVGAR